MSYHLMLNFRQLTSPTDVFDVMNLVHDKQTKSLEEIIQSYWPYLPSFHKNEKQNWLEGWDSDSARIEAYLHTFYYYWPKLNLLAIAGDKFKLGESTFNEFPCHIYFQNQSDNNYDTGIYSRIPIFKAIAESRISTKFQVEQFHEIKDDCDPELMYEIQTEIYETILKLLDLENFIHNDYSPDIHVINTSFMRTYKDHMNVKTAYSAVHCKYNQNRKETQNTHDMAESSEN